MNHKKIMIVSLVALIFCFQRNYAQINEGGIPLSFTNSSCSSEIQYVYMPLVNNDSLIALDSTSYNSGGDCSHYLFNFGISLQANYDFKTSGTWELLPDGSKLWRIHLVSNGAYSNYLIFDKFYLPHGTKLFAYNEGRDQILGAFTHKNNKSDKRFSLGPVLGKSVILEYHEPIGLDTTAEISIEAFIHSFKDIYTHTIGSSGTCNINVRCPEGNNWCNQRRAVALIAKISGTPGHFAAHCSGALVTNERRDGRPYFLTANHCIDGQNPSDFIFIFNYQSQDCNNPTTAPPTTFSISGATTRANHSNSDFALLELSSRPPGNYNVYYAGWDNENERPESGVGIHHPKGDIKKISTYSDKPERKNVDGIKVWELQFDKGVVEPGSSGSPLFNEDNLVVGQLFGTYSADPISCNNTDGFALYGRFDISWDDKSGSSNQLSPWLSPNSTSNTYIQSMSGDEPCKPSYFFQNVNDLHTSANIDGLSNPGTTGTRSYNGVYTASGTIETGQNVTIQSGTSVEFYGETIILGPGFTAEAGSHFVASPQPCLRGCNTGVGKMASPDLVSNDEDFIVLNTDAKKEEKDKEEQEKPKTVIISDNIQIYPNPNAGMFEVAFSGDYSISSKIIIYDAVGKLVYEQNNIIHNKVAIDISRYQKGIYTVQIIQNENSYTKKIILQ